MSPQMKKPEPPKKPELTAREMQSMGGKARMKSLSRKQRVDQAKKAIEARWKKYRAARERENEVTE
jgi:hypothetical protein